MDIQLPFRLSIACVLAAISVALLVAGSAQPAAAQSSPPDQRIEMSELGATAVVPADWELEVSRLIDEMPRFGMYHLMNAAEGQFLELRLEECSSWQIRLNDFTEAAESDQAPAHSPADDRVWLLGDDAPFTVAGSTAFESLQLRENMTWKSYEFFLLRQERCYTIRVGAPEQGFDSSLVLLKSLADNLAFTD